MYPCWARYCHALTDFGTPPFPASCGAAFWRTWLSTDWLTGRPPLVNHCWLMIHAEPGTFSLLVTSGAK